MGDPVRGLIAPLAPVTQRRNSCFEALMAARMHPYLDSPDANDDGKLDVADAISILSHFFGGAGDLPDLFGGCGIDPSSDGLECESSRPSE